MDANFAESEAQRIRKRLVRLITSVVVIFFILIDARQRNPGVPLFQKPLSVDVLDIFSTSEDVEQYAAVVQLLKESLWARIIALDQYSSDPTRKSEHVF